MSTCPDCRFNPCQCETIESLRARVAELERDNAEHAAILESQDRTLIRYREALENILANEGAYNRGDELSAYIAHEALKG